MPRIVLQLGSCCLISANAFDRLDAGADVVFVAGADRENQRIEDDVFGLDAVLFSEQLERTLRHLQLALRA